MVHWFTDGSTGFTINGNVVTFDDEKGDNNIHNAMWLEGDGVSSGKHYWKIQFPTLADSAGVGLTSKNLFKKGYACKAIVYFGSATCTKQWAIPDDYVGGTGIEGNWKLVKLQSYGVLVDLPAKQDDGAWRKYLFAHALLTQGPFEYMNVEYLIAELMQIGINSIDVDANKNLLVESDHTFSTWTRIDPPPQPSTFVGDPFEQKHYMSNKNKHGR
ncbi:hypothetical protein Bhyg_01051, partial [Pseudolycoriella hygida]